MIRRACLLCLVMVAVSTPVVAQTPTSPDCAPAWTSWWTSSTPCGVGRVCADVFGYRIEVLAGDEADGYLVRDLDGRFCRPLTLRRRDVVYTTGKDFKFSDCALPAPWIVEFAAFPAGCYPRATVLSVHGGAVTVRP